MINYLKNSNIKIILYLKLKYKIMMRVSKPIYFINILFQSIFRINSNCEMQVNYTSRITHPNKIKYHKDIITLTSFATSGNCYIQATNGIEIGKNFLFAPSIKIISSNHDYEDGMKSKKGNPIVLGSNIWIGTGSIILPEVTIGDNCIIGAGSVVTKSFPKNSIIAGNPAKLIKKRNL